MSSQHSCINLTTRDKLSRVSCARKRIVPPSPSCSHGRRPVALPRHARWCGCGRAPRRFSLGCPSSLGRPSSSARCGCRGMARRGTARHAHCSARAELSSALHALGSALHALGSATRARWRCPRSVALSALGRARRSLDGGQKRTSAWSHASGNRATATWKSSPLGAPSDPGTNVRVPSKLVVSPRPEKLW